ncbi:hypothetical protein SCLCIDRAFT_29396 [Scleroderma citrinum Foug A]|uniref:Zn(2)-C6 fungal-type domain-containing protein n=1 Tax=Scleroderma citrinum Foug A TaxID=1036808 RepID=A0A0C3DKS0_9AGAM|nr:hypothetical protein SCLCIDRAFT_29396 [Scleroderma citrinum Foug A]
MSAPSKSNTPTPVTTTQSKDWMKAVTPELNARTDDKTEERQCQEQEERERKEREEAEHKVKEEAEKKVAEEQQVRDEAARAQMAAKRAWAESKAEQAWIEVEKKRVAEEEAAKKRAAEFGCGPIKIQKFHNWLQSKHYRPSGSGDAEVGGTGACCMHCVKAKAKCKRSSRKHQHACDRCVGLKEKCEWLEAGSTRVGKGKGKELQKPVVALPCGGKKCKRLKKVATKDDNNNNEIEEVAGPSKGKGKERVRSRSGSGSRNNEQIVQGLDQLVLAVEKLTKGVITEQILHKYKLFLTLESEGEEWESKEEVNQVEVEAEVKELGCEMVEARDPGLSKKKGSVSQKEPVIDNSGEGFDGE